MIACVGQQSMHAVQLPHALEEPVDVGHDDAHRLNTVVATAEEAVLAHLFGATSGDRGIERFVSHFEETSPGVSERIERTGLDQRFDGPLVEDAHIHPIDEVPEVLEHAVGRAFGNDVGNHRLADVANRREAERDCAVDPDEVRVYYYHAGGDDKGWYPAENVEGWLVPGSYLYLDLDGATVVLDAAHGGGAELAPLVLRSNELIMEERAQLLAMLEAGQSDDPWLRALAEKYRVAKPEDPALDRQQLDELLHRVDLVPNSLALAQTIEESGWGTSRFADVGNAMFGQWAWGEDAIKPEQQRSGKGNYGIRAFDSPQDSVNGYMLNINSHPAYADLRNKRVAIRGEGRVPTGPELTDTLLKYSERGQHYVDTLNSIMRVNKLVEIDEAHLIDPVILLVPVGEGAD